MATLDEVLGGLGYLEDSVQFMIDENMRTIAVPANGVIAGVVGDKNINRINFQMARMYNGFDMSTFETRINYVNTQGLGNYYTVTDVTVNEDKIMFTWLIDSDVTAAKGTVNFVVKLIKANGGVVAQSFSTTIANIRVIDGLDVSDQVTPEEITDILNKLKTDADAYLAESVPSILDKLKTDADAYLAESVPSILDKLKTDADAYLAESVPESYDNLENEVTQARVAAGDIIHPNLKARLDSSDAYILNVDKKTMKVVTPQMYGAKGDGVTDDTHALTNCFLENANGKTINLSGKRYLVTKGFELENLYITNGTIIYHGSVNERIFILRKNSGLVNINVEIETVNYASDVVYVDYMPEGNNWVTGKYIIDGLYIKNTAETTTFVENSTCVRIRYYSYQVVWGQTINNLTFDGLMDYGIYIEPWLKKAEYNPVYNTSVFSNVLLHTVNCALKVLPLVGDPIESAVPAVDTETKGGIGLYLNRFSNQNNNNHTKPFMDLHNTSIEGDMVVPWDYYGDRMPEDGIFKLFKSKVYLNREYMHDSNDKRDATRVGWTEYSTGEKFTNCNAFSIDNVGEGSPYRGTLESPWSIDNARIIRFTADGKTLLGMQYSFNNSSAPKGQNTVQFGFYSGFPYVRKWDKDTLTWGELLPLHVNGNMPTSNDNERPDGVRVGDVKFDTSQKYPIWWNGSTWIKADGNNYDTPNITRTSQLINDSGIVTKENIVSTSIDTDGTIYNEIGYISGRRINSSGDISSTAGTAKATGFISVNEGVTLIISGCDVFNDGSVDNAIAVYDDNFDFIGSFTGQPASYGAFKDSLADQGFTQVKEENGALSWRIPEGAGIAYVRISLDCGENGIIHVSPKTSSVYSVNGKTGVVTLSASDVGAMDSSTHATKELKVTYEDGTSETIKLVVAK